MYWSFGTHDAQCPTLYYCQGAEKDSMFRPVIVAFSVREVLYRLKTDGEATMVAVAIRSVRKILTAVDVGEKMMYRSCGN